MTTRRLCSGGLAVCAMLLIREPPPEQMAYGAEGVALAQKPDRSPQRVCQQLISRNILALGDPEFLVRETATRRLIAIGSLAIEELLPALESQDPEVAWRAKVCVEAIVQFDQSALAVLQNFKESQSLHVSELTNAIIERKQSRQNQIQENAMRAEWYRMIFESQKAREIERNLGFE